MMKNPKKITSSGYVTLIDENQLFGVQLQEHGTSNVAEENDVVILALPGTAIYIDAVKDKESFDYFLKNYLSDHL